MADLGMIARATKRVTLDDIYTSLDSLKDQQGEESRHLNQRIDTVNQRIDNLSSQVSQKIDTQVGQMRQEIGQLNQRIDNLGQKMDTQFAQLNQTILQFLMGKQNNK